MAALAIAAIAAVAALALAACGSGSSDTPAANPSGDPQLVSAGNLTVGTHLSYKPFELKDDAGKVVGFDMDRARTPRPRGSTPRWSSSTSSSPRSLPEQCSPLRRKRGVAAFWHVSTTARAPARFEREWDELDLLNARTADLVDELVAEGLIGALGGSARQQSRWLRRGGT